MHAKFQDEFSRKPWRESEEAVYTEEVIPEQMCVKSISESQDTLILHSDHLQEDNF